MVVVAVVVNKWVAVVEFLTMVIDGTSEDKNDGMGEYSGSVMRDTCVNNSSRVIARGILLYTRAC